MTTGYTYTHLDLKMARIADFTNFSKDMSIEGNYPITLEYFCFENEKIWNDTDENIIAIALEELKNIFLVDFNIVHSAVTRNPKAYPVIRTGYEEYYNY